MRIDVNIPAISDIVFDEEADLLETTKKEVITRIAQEAIDEFVRARARGLKEIEEIYSLLNLGVEKEQEKIEIVKDEEL